MGISKGVGTVARTLIGLALLLGSSFLLAGCGLVQPVTISGPTVPVLTSLEGTEWVLTSLRDAEPLSGSTLKLAFYADNYMEGTAGCNSYGVDYTAEGQRFQLATVHKTDFDCQEPPGVMPQDKAFFEALASVVAYQASEERLAFQDAFGERVLVYARKLPAAVDPALEDTEWLLRSLLGEDLVAGSRITLNLGPEGFEGYAGCNNYGGQYEAADGGVLLTSQINSTSMDCPTPDGIEGIMEQETAYLQALRSAAAYLVADGRLEIAGASGQASLVFDRKAEFTTDPADLLGTGWRLLAVDGEALSEGSTFTLSFYDEIILGGHAGCRDYLAAYQATGDDLTLMLEAMFDGDCKVEDADLELEAQVLEVMGPKADLRLGEAQLEIHGEKGGVLVFEPLPEEANLDLEGPAWSLLAFVGPNPNLEEPEPWPMPAGPLRGTEMDLTFEAGAGRGSTGCNHYGAA